MCLRIPVFRYFSVTPTNLFLLRKNINPENFLRNEKQESPCQSLESFSKEYYNMENKILDFQFGPMCANQTLPNYSVGSESKNEAEIQYDQWSTPEWCNCEKCEKISTS